MSEQKHTPGPWEIQSQGPTEQVYVIDNPRISFVCRMEEGTQEQKKVNARLIAAAPEMLESLRDTCRIIQGWEHATPMQIANVADKARAAIAKAEGGEV